MRKKQLFHQRSKANDDCCQYVDHKNAASLLCKCSLPHPHIQHCQIQQQEKTLPALILSLHLSFFVIQIAPHSRAPDAQLTGRSRLIAVVFLQRLLHSLADDLLQG